MSAAVMQFRCTRLNAWLKADDCATRSTKADGGQKNVRGMPSGDAAAYACCADCPVGAAHRKLGGKIMDGLHVRALPSVGSSPVPPPPKPKEAPPTPAQDRAKNPEPPVKGSKPSKKTREKVCADCGSRFDGHWNAKRCGPCSASHVYPSAQRRSGGKVIPIAPKVAPAAEEHGTTPTMTIGEAREAAAQATESFIAYMRSINHEVDGETADLMRSVNWGSIVPNDGQVRALMYGIQAQRERTHGTTPAAETPPSGPTPTWTPTKGDVSAIGDVLELAGYVVDEDVVIVPSGVMVLVKGEVA